MNDPTNEAATRPAPSGSIGEPSTAPRILLVSSLKGGTGKTSVATLVSHVIASEYGRSTAVLDLDPQSSLTTFLGCEPSSDPIHESPVERHGMLLFRGGITLTRASSAEIELHVERALALRSFVVIDTPGTPDDGGRTRALFHRPDTTVLIVAAAEPRSIPETRKLAARAEAAGVPFRILINRLNRRSVSRQCAEVMRTFWGGLVCDAPIPDLADIGHAEMRREPLTIVQPRSRVVTAARAVVAQLLSEGMI